MYPNFSFTDKPNSIAAAAASGFLKVPGMNEPAKTAAEQTSSSQSGVGLNIADAAKSGFLRVPTVGEKKGQKTVTCLSFVQRSSVTKFIKIERVGPSAN